jgi:hypothetical protein
MYPDPHAFKNKRGLSPQPPHYDGKGEYHYLQGLNASIRDTEALLESLKEQKELYLRLHPQTSEDKARKKIVIAMNSFLEACKTKSTERNEIFYNAHSDWTCHGFSQFFNNRPLAQDSLLKDIAAEYKRLHNLSISFSDLRDFITSFQENGKIESHMTTEAGN